MNTSDDTLVYIDPDARLVIGPVEWEGDNPKKLPRERTGDATKKMKRMYYPYCTARTAKRFLEKKHQRQDDEKLSLEEALQKAVTEPFWN
jgi:hypothetical protein